MRLVSECRSGTDCLAAQQIEGGVDADGRGESIWDRFSREQKHKVQDGSTSDIVSVCFLLD